MLYLQLDDCWRENNNRYLTSFLQCLVAWSVFKMVAVGFLPVGHTQTDIDQRFSTTSKRLDTHDAITKEDLHNVLSQCYDDHTVVSILKEVGNWSGLCESKGCLNKVKNRTQYCFFRLSRDKPASWINAEECSVSCVVKTSFDDTWTDL